MVRTLLWRLTGATGPRLRRPPSLRVRQALLVTVACTLLLDAGHLAVGVDSGDAPRPLLATGDRPLRAASVVLTPTTRGPAPAAAASAPSAAPPGPRVTTVTGDATAGDVAARALARISYPWHQLGYQIRFLGPRPGYRGQTVPSQQRIDIYLSPGEPVDLVAHVLAHEIGHAIDFSYGDDTRHQRWLDVRGIAADTPWYGCSGCNDFATPAGDFAETFAYWQLGDSDYSRMSPAPDAQQLQSLVPLFQPPAPQPAPQPSPPTTAAAPSTAAGGPQPLLCINACGPGQSG